MNKMRLVIAALMISYASAASAGILDNLTGSKHLFHCDTTEAARKCGGDCWIDTMYGIGHYTISVNSATNTVAVKFTGDNPATSRIEYVHGCDISDSGNWTCRETVRSEEHAIESTRTSFSVNGAVWETYRGRLINPDGSMSTPQEYNNVEYYCYK